MTDTLIADVNQQALAAAADLVDDGPGASSEYIRALAELVLNLSPNATRADSDDYRIAVTNHLFAGDRNTPHASGGWELHPNHVTTAGGVPSFDRAAWIDHVHAIHAHLTPAQVRQVVTIVERELNAHAATPGYRGVDLTRIAARVQLGKVTS